MASICVWKGGETLKVPLTTDRDAASAEGVPTAAVWLGGQAHYAYASKSSDNAVIAFMYGGETYYLVSELGESDVAKWTTVFEWSVGGDETDSAGAITTAYTLPSEYGGRVVRLRVEQTDDKIAEGTVTLDAREAVAGVCDAGTEITCGVYTAPTAVDGAILGAVFCTNAAGEKRYAAYCVQYENSGFPNYAELTCYVDVGSLR